MTRTIEINTPTQPFEDRLDFTRGNPDRKTFGKTENTSHFNLGAEYDMPAPPPEAQQPPDSPAPPVPPKFTHKLGNGTVLEAESVEALAAKIEQALQTPPAPPKPAEEFEDKFPYQPLEFKRRELSLQEQANILNIWKENPQKANRMLQEAEFGQTMETIIANMSRLEAREMERATMEAGLKFMEEIEEYSPTQKNGKLLQDYLNEHKKPVTTHNLKVAYQRLLPNHPELKTAPVVTPSVPEIVDDSIQDSPAPPSVLPSNTGTPPPAPSTGLDPKFAAEFASWPLAKQQAYFAEMRRKQH